MDINLNRVSKALENLEVLDDFGKNEAIDHLRSAINELKIVKDEMEIIPIQGRDRVDTLLGCMLGIDMIIGKEEDDG